MAGETNITVVGRLTADPELRFIKDGLAVANFTVATNSRRFDRVSGGFQDGDTLFLRCAVWREQAEHAAESLTKGDHVVAYGNLEQRSWETKPADGSPPERRTSVELRVEHVAAALQYATVTIQRVSKSASTDAAKAAA